MTNPEHLFFAQFIIEQKKISDSINIALKKVHGQTVTASQVKSTWFMTLSCADLRWPELFQIIAKTKGHDLSDEEVEALSYIMNDVQCLI